MIDPPEKGDLMSDAIGFEVHLDQPYERALELVTAALKSQGFGVLTHIDVKTTLKEKLGAQFRPYAILGACNPTLAHRALSHDASIGLMLPCNVTVEASDGGGSLVRIANPDLMLAAGEFGEDQVLRQVAQQAREKLESVAQILHGQ
jgi:uncharacterized protein (DUF302 family)